MAGVYDVIEGLQYSQPRPCHHCGMYHTGTCPRVKAIEYHPNGTIKRIEYHAPEPEPETRYFGEIPL